MRKILFPFELDNPAYMEAYVYGIKLARNINAEMIVLNVFQLEVGNDITMEKYNNLKKTFWFKAYNEVTKFNNYFLQEHARVDSDLKIRFDYRFIHGIFLDEIRNIAGEEEVDLIVLPISDNREFNKRQLKIIRDNIFEKNRASILVIPFFAKFRPTKTIVFATDLKRLNGYKQYLKEVVAYAKAFDANIHFLHISPREKAAEWEKSETYREMQQIVTQHKGYVFHNIYSKHVIDTVNQYVDDHNADLLVVVKQQHYFLDTLFHESISNRISLNSKVPVMIMREKRD